MTIHDLIVRKVITYTDYISIFEEYLKQNTGNSIKQLCDDNVDVAFAKIKYYLFNELGEGGKYEYFHLKWPLLDMVDKTCLHNLAISMMFMDLSFSGKRKKDGLDVVSVCS